MLLPQVKLLTNSTAESRPPEPGPRLKGRAGAWVVQESLEHHGASPVYVSADAIWRWGFAVSLRQCRTFARFARWILNQAWHGPCLPAPRKEGPESRGSAAGML